MKEVGREKKGADMLSPAWPLQRRLIGKKCNVKCYVIWKDAICARALVSFANFEALRPLAHVSAAMFPSDDVAKRYIHIGTRLATLVGPITQRLQAER